MGKSGEFSRVLDLGALLRKTSFFFLGPRWTGKSYWIRKSLPEVRSFDLLDDDVYDALLRRPTGLGEQIPRGTKHIVIDEIQKLPRLLDEVHRLIETRRIHFLLTGSSARKLRRGGANLLAGRAWTAEFFPLVRKEIPNFNLQKYLNVGGLPRVWNSESPREELKAYTRTYLTEEIKAEALVRSYERFVRFLDTMALCNGKELNFQEISRDAGVPPRTLEGYIEVLEDTLIGYQLRPFTKTKKRKAVSRSKFYFFDLGVANRLRGLESITPGSADFGAAFEHFLLNEARAYNAYSRKDVALSYWRSRETEVDLLIGREVAIEVKSAERIKDSFFRGLEALASEKLFSNYYLVSRAREEGRHGVVRYLHYETFLDELWAGDIF